MLRTITSCLLAACVATPALAQDLTEQDARKAAGSMAAKYVQTFNATDPEGIANLFTEDGTYLPAFGGALMGRSAIKNMVAARMKR
ncbi:MAG: SgcJ/EcaC family oxidoreductase [Acetobacteraceae bacterium]